MNKPYQEAFRFRDQVYMIRAWLLRLAHTLGASKQPLPEPSCLKPDGYVGSWEVQDDRLFLIDVLRPGPRLADYDPTKKRRGNAPAWLKSLFSKANHRGVLAEWVTAWIPIHDEFEHARDGVTAGISRTRTLAFDRGRLVAVFGEFKPFVATAPLELLPPGFEGSDGELPPRFTPMLDAVYGDEARFIRALHRTCDPSVTLLVYADWLDERGDPRGHLLRLVVELRNEGQRWSSEQRPHEFADFQSAKSQIEDGLWLRMVGLN